MEWGGTPEADRYEGRPLLRLLDCYILEVIGQLDERQRETLVRMEPKLQLTFKSSGSWANILEEQMDFMPSVPGKIRDFWLGYQQHARSQVKDPNPFEFVR